MATKKAKKTKPVLFIQRMPEKLHGKAVRKASERFQSLNGFINSVVEREIENEQLLQK